MKKLMVIALAFSIFSVSLTSAGCFGSFTATKKVYHWNSERGGKFVNSVVMWVLLVVPIYSFATAADFLILNTLEFWTGSNPLAMKEGESEEQNVTLNGKAYKLNAELNKITVTPADGNGVPVTLRFDAEKGTWMMESNGLSVPVAQQNAANGKLTLIKPDGTTVTLPSAQ